MSCRLSNVGPLPPAEFNSASCASCLYFIYLVGLPYRALYKSKICPGAGLLICDTRQPHIDDDCNCNNSSLIYNIPEYAVNSSWITPLTALNLTPQLPDHFLEITTECCAAAKRCCENTLSPARKPTTKSQIQKVLGIQPQGGCEATWDGWQCFEAASANTNVTKECPVYIYGDYIKIPEFDNFALKRCDEDGWSKQQDREYTDYSRCSPSKVEEVELKLIVGIVAYSTSVVFLLPAVFLLFSLRRIREQPMFTLHRHLLISFLFYGILYLVNVLIFIVEDAPLSIFVFTNNIFCRLLFTIQLRFLRLSNFSWMLAEGIYLYRLLLSTQTSEGEDLTVYVVLCWGIPALLAGFYSLVRWLYDSGGMCWVENSHLLWVEWSIIVPSLLAILVNVLLLMFIMYILVKKLRCNPHLERIQYRKAVRAAFMLMPVFGLQQLFTIVRLSNTFYQVLDISLNGLQGFFVSLIICYTNKTVLESVSKWWTSHRDKRQITRECNYRVSIQHDHMKPLVQRQSSSTARS